MGGRSWQGAISTYEPSATDGVPKRSVSERYTDMGSSYEIQSQLHPLDLTFNSTLLTASIAMLSQVVSRSVERSTPSPNGVSAFLGLDRGAGVASTAASSGGVSIESANAKADQPMTSPGSLNNRMHAKPQSIEYLLPRTSSLCCVWPCDQTDVSF